MINWQFRKKVVSHMRRRVGKFLPIVLIALLVQIFAPVGATWAASIAASDPLHAAAICSGGMDSSHDQADQTGQHRAHEGCCSVCSVAHTGAPVDTPQSAIAISYRSFVRVVWLDHTPDMFGSRTGYHAQARAPPLLT
jgi:Protein of unknown function (DUF2946)